MRTVRVHDHIPDQIHSVPRPRLMRVYVDVLMPDATLDQPMQAARRRPPRRAVGGRRRRAGR